MPLLLLDSQVDRFISIQQTLLQVFPARNTRHERAGERAA
jgi:hypothetical protein